MLTKGCPCAVRVDGKELGLHTRGQLSKQVYAMVTPTGSIAISRPTSGSAFIIETGALRCCLWHAVGLLRKVPVQSLSYHVQQARRPVQLL